MMNSLSTRIPFIIIFLMYAALSVQATCPTDAPTVVEVCHDAGGNSIIRAYFFDGTAGNSYFLFNLNTASYVSDPLGPVTVNTTIPLPPGAVAGVEFGLVPNGDYIIRVFCSPGGPVNIGGLGINVNSGNAMNVGVTVDPDCNPATGGANADGSITLNISGGKAPYDITWPAAVTPIADRNNVAAGNHLFSSLDGGAYTVNVVDANNCVFTANISVPLATLPQAGPDQTVCGTTANLNANSPGTGESGTWSGPAGVIFFPNANAVNAIVSNLAVGANTLTWTITDTNGICPGIADQVTITSDAPATVDAGPAQAICSGSTAQLVGTIGGSATSATWTTSGDGSFNNNTILNAVYTPGSGDVTAGTVTLTLTTNDPTGPCVSVSDNIVITINASVAVDAGPAQTICSDGTATLAGTFGSAATSATWSTSGDGTFNDNTLANAIYTPGPNDITANTVTLTFTTNDPPGPCLPASDNVVITIDDVATANAGPSQAVCSGNTISLSGSIGGSATSATWSTSGDGTFNNSASLTAIYTPGAADLTAGLVTLTLTTNDPAGPCAAVNANVTHTISAPPTVEAGPAQTICAGGTATLAASFGGTATSAAWTTSGDGTFDNSLSATAIYTPGATDISNGTVTLTFTTNDPPGPCAAVNDNVVITIDATPTANAGGAQTICTGSTVALAGTLGGSATSAIWTSSGDGSFDNASSLTAVYTPGTADQTSGNVTLTLTTNDPPGPCVATADNVVITINTAATVDAGPAQAICSNGTATLAATFGGAATSGVWSTSGDGSFNNNSLVNAVYTPGPNDILTNSVTLTFSSNDPAGPCPASSDNVTITIEDQPLVNAGTDQVVCSGTAVALSATIGGAASSATWTTSGDGSFDNASSLTAVYTQGAADITSGTVTLTLTTDDPAGVCAAATDDILITINPGAIVDAGAAQTVCAGSTATLAGSFAGAATSATWTTSGDGTFSDNTSSTAIYTPGAADVANGAVTLVFATNDPAGPCPSVSDNVVITINAVPTADAGASQTICAGSSATLAGILGGSASSATWTTAGDGTFNDATSVNATYSPGAADIAAGSVTLTITTNDPAGPCTATNDNVVITIDPAPTAEAGNAQIICSGGTAVLTGSSVGATATTGAWSIVSGPVGGDGSLSITIQTPTPSLATFTATIAGAYTLRLTTDDPAGVCGPATDDVIITVTAGATVDAGPAQTICAGGTATLAATFTGTSGISWTTSGDGTFDNASLPNAVYTPGANDISSTTVTLVATTAGPCASVNDNVVITINAAPAVDAGSPQTICSSAAIVLTASFGGSATGLLWSTSGNGIFDDNTDPNATYTPGTNDVSNGSVTLTATATGSCPGTSDNVLITVNPAATVDAGNAQTTCIGSTATLNATLGGAATSMTWTTSGDGTFNNNTDPDAIYTPGTNDIANGSVTLRATTNNPPGPCPAVSDIVVITIIPIPGDQTTPGNETWIGYVYTDAGDPTPIPAKIDFQTSKYRGFIGENDIDNMSGASIYDAATDEFDMNLGLAIPVQGPNVCGSYLDFFSARYKMNKTLPAGVYRFTVGGDDGVRLLVDGVNVLDPAAFDFQSYTTHTSAPVCLTAGVHAFEIHYFDNTAYSRLSFQYEAVPALNVTSPVVVCMNSPAPALSVSSPDPDILSFRWYKNGILVFTGAAYTPAPAELDMATAGNTVFEVTAEYACGETVPQAVVVSVVNSATLVINPQTLCESGGIVDLRTFISASPPGGSFVFSGHANISGNNFDPSGLAGSTAAILVDYSAGSCTAPQGTLNLTITNTASVTTPASAVAVCESSPDIDLTTLVSAAPAGGVFSFSGTQVTGNMFDPSGLAGIQTITVNYNAGGCTAPPANFDLDVTATANITTSNTAVCENGSVLNLLGLVSSSPPGGTFTFSGAGVSGSLFNPSGQSGVVNVNVDYDFNGCADNGTIQITIRPATDPLCTGGNCASVVISPKPEPATCTNSDGRMVMSIKPFTPAVNNTGVKITIDGTSSTGLTISRTNFNDTTFNLLPVGNYTYSIEYGDPSCVKTGVFSIDQSGTVGTPVVSNVTNPVCFGSATGSLTLDIPGETGNILEWSIDGGLNDPFKPFTAGGQITGLRAGPEPSYRQVISVRRNISDVCYSSVTVVITESVSEITATFGVRSATCNGNDGAITGIVASGGYGAPFSFSIDGGQSYQTSPDFNGLPGGSYTLRIRDAIGCERDYTVNITFPGFINSIISKNNADCTNGGDSGRISVSVNDAGTFLVALSTDQFNAPPDNQYVSYSNPSVAFNGLARGQYFVYIKSTSGVCPTRSAPIDIFGVYAVTFDIEPNCPDNELSFALVNVTGDADGAPLEIQISKKMSSDPPEIVYVQFPVSGEIYLDREQYTFLQTPGEYRIQIIQFQDEVICNFASAPVDITVTSPLSAQIVSVSESYPDIPSGTLVVGGFTGGAFPYDVRIEMDSASSFALPFYKSEFQQAGVNGNQQIEMSYDEIPAGRYQVEVMDATGCILNLLARVPLDVDLYVPNVFTPNDDGANDIFFIRNLPQESSSNQLTITNRWGKVIFESDNYQNNWNGAGAADGIYFYSLQVSNDQAVTGWVEIIRGLKP